MTSQVATLRAEIEANADRFKGLLILVVAADHNDWFRKLAPAIFEPLTFHVLGFLLLVFTFGSRQWGFRFVADRAARYLVPYWWALTAASVAFFFLYRNHGALGDAGVDWMLAALLGNAPFVKSSSGLLMLWFLPALFGLVCIVALYDAALSGRQRAMAFFLAIICHLFLPLAPHEGLFWLPFGLAIAANIFLLGLLWRRMIIIALPKFWGPVVCAIFVVSYSLLVLRPVRLEIATLDFLALDSGIWFFLQDAAGVAGVLAALWLAGLPQRAGWLEEIGKKSLLIYLLHPVAYVLLGKIWPVAGGPHSSAMLLVKGGAALICTLLLSYLLARLVSRSRLLSGWVTPRSWEQWAPVCLLSRIRY